MLATTDLILARLPAGQALPVLAAAVLTQPLLMRTSDCDNICFPLPEAGVWTPAPSSASCSSQPT